MSNLKEIKYDWITSDFYKEKRMDKWATHYFLNNDVDFDLLKFELNELIMEDNAIGLNSFNRYGAFEMLLSTIPNALVTSLISASKNVK